MRTHDIRETAQKRGERPVLVIDIAVPRSVDPAVGDLPGIRLCNVDDLKEVADKGARERIKAAEKAEEIIARRIEDILKKVKSCDIVPVMVGIRQKAERIRKEGLEKAAGKLSVSPRDRDEIESLTKSIVSKILFHSEVEMREYSNSIKR
jgi:glutamyl-tRNA reductase